MQCVDRNLNLARPYLAWINFNDGNSNYNSRAGVPQPNQKLIGLADLLNCGDSDCGVRRQRYKAKDTDGAARGLPAFPWIADHLPNCDVGNDASIIIH